MLLWLRMPKWKSWIRAMASAIAGGGQCKVGPYEVTVYGSSAGIKLIPSSFVRNSEYRPSKEVGEQITHMWNRRRPRVIGLVSEAIATEILSNGRIDMDGSTWALSCRKLRNVREISGMWRPRQGIYCDDLVATAESHGKKLLLLAEVKGTTLEGGLSHSVEAKIFYQLARTCVTLKRLMRSGPCYPIRGAITVTIIHSWRRITVNVLNEAAIIGYFPDGWLRPGERY